MSQLRHQARPYVLGGHFALKKRVNCCQLSCKEEVLGLGMNWPWTGEEDIFFMSPGGK